MNLSELTDKIYAEGVEKGNAFFWEKQIYFMFLVVYGGWVVSVLYISKCNLACNLVKVFEEAKFRCVKVQFFSGSVV